MKNIYNHHNADPKLSAFTQKISRIKKTIAAPFSEEYFLSSWKRAGFNLEITNGEISNITINNFFFEELKKKGRKQVENQKYKLIDFF